MNANFKLAPLSCHCKLNVLVHHLRKISAQKAMAKGKEIPVGMLSQSEKMFRRFI